jgi:hypothetical protein
MATFAPKNMKSTESMSLVLLCLLGMACLDAAAAYAGDPGPMAPKKLKTLRICSTDDCAAVEAMNKAQALPDGARLAALRDRVWKDRSTIRVRFMGGCASPGKFRGWSLDD